MKLPKLVIISIFVAIFLIPMASAEIQVNNVVLPDVVASSVPNFGTVRFSIVAGKLAGQDESLTLPVIVNGTKLQSIIINMKANEVSKIVITNATFPGATILITNPFATPPPIPNDITYVKSMDPYANPISSIRYDVKIGGFTKKVTLLVYADWTLWAIIIDIVAVAVSVLFIKRLLT